MIECVAHPYRDQVKDIIGRPIGGKWLSAHLLAGKSKGVNQLRSERLRGGRFHPPRQFPAMYLAEDTQKCRSRALAWAATESARVPVIAVLEVRLGNVLDLSDPAVRRSLGIRCTDLARSEDMSVTRAIGVAAYQSGFEGILYPRPLSRGSRNLAIFPDHLDVADLAVIEADLSGLSP